MRQGSRNERLYLCRANGEGSHSFKVCDGELAVFAFYKEMFGEEEGGGIQLAIDHFRDADNWSNGGEAYSCELYCATFEVWKVHPDELKWHGSEKPAHIDRELLGEVLNELHNLCHRIEHIGDFYATKNGPFYRDARRAHDMLTAALFPKPEKKDADAR